MTRRGTPTKLEKLSALEGAALDREIFRIAATFPGHVLYETALPTGERVVATVVPRHPATQRRRRGAYCAVAEADIPLRWQAALTKLRRDHVRVTTAAIATELGVSVGTVYNWRKRYGLLVGDEAA